MTDKELRLECLRLACAQGVEDPVRVAREMYDWVRGGGQPASEVSFKTLTPLGRAMRQADREIQDTIESGNRRHEASK